MTAEAHQPKIEAWKMAVNSAMRAALVAGQDGVAKSLSEVLARLAARPPRSPIRWMFTHRGEGGKLYYTYHDETPENDYRFAYRDTCIATTPLYDGEPDPWADAVQDALTINFLDWNGLSPREAVAKLIKEEVSQALDPRISEAARALQQGKEPNPEAVTAPKMEALAAGTSATAHEPPDLPGLDVPHYGEQPNTGEWFDFVNNPPKSSGEYIVKCLYEGRETEMDDYHTARWTWLATLTVETDTDSGVPRVTADGDIDESDIQEYAMVPGNSYYYAPVAPPAIGSRWKHRKGNIYKVLGYSNMAGGDFEKFPPMVRYETDLGQEWSRPLTDWYRSFTFHATE